MRTTSTSASDPARRRLAPPLRTLAVTSEDRGAVICERCEVADLPLSRLRGLLGRRKLEPGSGMLLEPSGSIHTFFMRFPIDAVFLDAELRVLEVRSRLAPWRVAVVKGGRAVLELAAGEGERRRISPGERLRLGSEP
ncbi:MAG: DUF192 domain-containing protein [Solirubrobacterales bacterium]|nr:DUF192 domain-containing protein [Solirubrobacterales bacterium]